LQAEQNDEKATEAAVCSLTNAASNQFFS